MVFSQVCSLTPSSLQLFEARPHQLLTRLLSQPLNLPPHFQYDLYFVSSGLIIPPSLHLPMESQAITFTLWNTPPFCLILPCLGHHSSSSWNSCHLSSFPGWLLMVMDYLPEKTSMPLLPLCRAILLSEPTNDSTRALAIQDNTFWSISITLPPSYESLVVKRLYTQCFCTHNVSQCKWYWQPFWWNDSSLHEMFIHGPNKTN